MSRQSPEVLEGMRPTRQALADKGLKVGLYARFRAAMADKLAAAKEARSATPDAIRTIVFNSRYTNHRIQLTAPRDQILMDGTKVKGRPLVAQFKDSTYKIPRHIEDEDAAVIVKKLRAHPAYGIGRDFWERADALDEGKLHKMAEVAQLLESDPDVKNGVLDFITAQEFEVDVATQEKTAAKVAEAQFGADPLPDDPEPEPEPDDDEPDAPPAPPAKRRGRKPGRKPRARAPEAPIA